MGYASGPETLHLPRILCLHGGGVTAQIFQLQMRVLAPALRSEFRFVFVDGPFETDMHPGLNPIFVDMGPYRRWAPWKPHHKVLPFKDTVEQIETSLVNTMAADAGTGDWVGILGFSQGAKLTFSILYENDLRRADPLAGFFAGVDFKFGVILAGPAPPYALSERTMHDARFTRPGNVSETTCLETTYVLNETSAPQKLITPTLHVHGLLDDGLELHRDFRRNWCAPHSDLLVEWEAEHRVPFKSGDVKSVVVGIEKIAILVSHEARCRILYGSIPQYLFNVLEKRDFAPTGTTPLNFGEVNLEEGPSEVDLMEAKTEQVRSGFELVPEVAVKNNCKAQGGNRGLRMGKALGPKRASLLTMNGLLR